MWAGNARLYFYTNNIEEQAAVENYAKRILCAQENCYVFICAGCTTDNPVAYYVTTDGVNYLIQKCAPNG